MTNPQRTSWIDYFIEIATVVARRSTCPSRQVGAVLVDPETNFIVSTGYNGSPMGMLHCDEQCLTRKSGEEWDKCRAIHGEVNCIISAARRGAKTDGTWLFLTVTPCLNCARIIINAGVQSVVALTSYSKKEGISLLEDAGIKVLILDEGGKL